MKYEYLAVFMPQTDVYAKNEDDRLHVRVANKPDIVDESLFGTPVLIKLLGYARIDGTEIFKVSLKTSNEQLKLQFKKIKRAFVTYTLHEDGTVMNGEKIKFEPIEGHMVFDGVYGGYTNTGQIILSAPETKSVKANRKEKENYCRRTHRQANYIK